MVVNGFFNDIKHMIVSLFKRKRLLSSGKNKRQVDPLKTLVKELHPDKKRYQISEKIQVGEDAYLFRLVNPDGGLPPFQCGQYVSFEFEIGQTLTSRAYSLCSAPNQALGPKPHFDVVIKKVKDGFISNYIIEKLKVGDDVTASLPYGQFFYNPIIDSQNLVFIAGGSGITPFYSFIQEVNDHALDVNIVLLYGSRSSKDIILKE